MVTINFGGCGGYVTYYMGIAMFLQNKYALSKLNVEYTASSAGVVPAFLLAIDFDIKIAYNQWFLPWMEKAKTADNPIFQNNVISHDFFQSMKPIFMKLFNQPEYLTLINEKLSICLTDTNLKRKYIRSWESIEDLFDCMCVSSSIPYFFMNKPTRRYKGFEYFDGSFLDNQDDGGNNKDLHNIQNTIFINFMSFQEGSDWQCLMNAGVLMLTLANEKISTKYFNLGYKNAEKNYKYFKILQNS